MGGPRRRVAPSVVRADRQRSCGRAHGTQSPHRTAAAAACIIFLDAPPGGGPSLHEHPYAEILVIQEGVGTFIVGDEQREAGAAEVLIVPADTPHAFTNTGRAPLRQIDIHLSRTFQTEWL